MRHNGINFQSQIYGMKSGNNVDLNDGTRRIFQKGDFGGLFLEQIFKLLS